MKRIFLKILLWLFALGVVTIILFPFLAEAQTSIYRSVKPYFSSAIFTSSGSVTFSISGSTGTFSSAAADTVGLGCVIKYDTSATAGSQYGICFIHGITSSTVFTVKRFNGGTPPPTSGTATDWNVYHAYQTLNDFDNGIENSGIGVAFDDGNRDIDTAGELWNIVCYNGADTSAPSIAGWTTSSTEYIKIFTPTGPTEIVGGASKSQRHRGKYPTYGYRIERSRTTSGHTLGVGAVSPATPRHIEIDGIAVSAKNTGAQSGIYLHPSTFTSADAFAKVKNCIIRGSDSASTKISHAGIMMGMGNATAKMYAINCIVYNFRSSDATEQGGIVTADGAHNGNAYVYNCTVINSQKGIRKISSGTVVFLVKNCIANDNTDGYLASTGSFDAASTNNTSDLSGDAPGSNATVGEVSFVDKTNRNLLLVTGDTVAKDTGTDLSADAINPFTDDIDQGTRPVNSTWDRGADEYGTGVTATSTAPARHRRLIITSN